MSTLVLKSRFVAGEVANATALNEVFEDIAENFDPEINMGLNNPDFADGEITASMIALHTISAADIFLGAIKGSNWASGSIQNQHIVQSATGILDAHLCLSGAGDENCHIVAFSNWTGADDQKMVLLAGYKEIQFSTSGGGWNTKTGDIYFNSGEGSSLIGTATFEGLEYLVVNLALVKKPDGTIPGGTAFNGARIGSPVITAKGLTGFSYKFVFNLDDGGFVPGHFRLVWVATGRVAV
jgi:hypothetical protein